MRPLACFTTCPVSRLLGARDGTWGFATFFGELSAAFTAERRPCDGVAGARPAAAAGGEEGTRRAQPSAQADTQPTMSSAEQDRRRAADDERRDGEVEVREIRANWRASIMPSGYRGSATFHRCLAAGC